MRQVQFHEPGNEYDVEILSGENQHKLTVTRWVGNTFFEDRSSGSYPNPVMLSEALRDAIGYGPARDILLKHGVEQNHPLMKLGEKG